MLLEMQIIRKDICTQVKGSYKFLEHRCGESAGILLQFFRQQVSLMLL